MAAKNPFALAVLTTINNQSGAIAQGITAQSLSALRVRFITEWFQKNAGAFPFRLFDYQQQLNKDSMLDAYNQWIFGEALDQQAFESWSKAHADEYNRFVNFQKGRIFKLPAGQYYQNAVGK